MLSAYGFTVIDISAVLFFFFSWWCHYWVVHHSRWRKKTISYHMDTVRVQWMRNMIDRDPKMMDALIQNGLQQGVLFFASTSILIVGALLAGLGATEQAIDFLTGIPFTTTTTRTVWEFKVLLVVFIFVFSFFKFAWSFRQFNYVLILLGAAPDGPRQIALAQKNPQLVDSLNEQYARKVARLHSLGAQHFTTGLNSYFFALAAFGWFLNPWVFLCATTWVSAVLYRRAFGSKFAGILTS